MRSGAIEAVLRVLGACALGALSGCVGDVLPGGDGGGGDSGAPIDSGGKPDAADSGGCDTQSDPSNCGRCGRDCMGGACQGGVCTPVTIAAGQSWPIAIAVDATDVYWATQKGGTVMKAPVGGGAPITLAMGLSGPSGIAIDGANVYFTTGAGNGGDVMSVPIAGGNTKSIAPGQNPFAIAIDATNVYWANLQTGTAMKAPLGGGMPTTLASNLSGPGGIAVDATSVYVTSYNGYTVTKAPITPGMATTLATGQNGPSTIAVDSTNAYWVDVLGNAIMKVAIGGGSPSTIAAQTGPWGVAVDATYVYFTYSAGAGQGGVKAVPIAGGAPIVLATGLDHPSPVATNASAVFFADLTAGTILRVPKP